MKYRHFTQVYNTRTRMITKYIDGRVISGGPNNFSIYEAIYDLTGVKSIESYSSVDGTTLVGWVKRREFDEFGT